jgi:hypothetical protein
VLGWLRWEELSVSRSDEEIMNKTYILVDTNVQEVLAVSAVLDDTLLAKLDGTHAGRLGEDGVGDNGVDKVGRAGLGVGGGNSSLLEGKELEVGGVEVVSDRALEGVRKVLLDEGLEERSGEPGCEPPVVLGDAKVKVSDLDVDILDGEEGLVVSLVGVLEGNVKVDTVGAELEVEETIVLEWPEASLLVDPEGNVAGLKVKTLDPESDRRVVLGSIGGVTLGESEVVVGNESDRVGDERSRLE